MDKPVGEDVGIGLDGDNEVGEERVEEQLLVIPSESPCGILGPVTILHEGSLYGLLVDGADDEVRKAAVVGLESFRAPSESDECGERGGAHAAPKVHKVWKKPFPK